MLVGEPVVDQPMLALVEVVELAGALVIETVGAAVVAVVTVQLTVALALPAEFETVTRKVCVPAARPL